MARTRRPKRSHRSRGRRFWVDAIARHQSSGLSRAKFCQREGLAVSTFDLWRRRLSEEKAESTTATLLPVEVIPASSALLRPGGGYEVVLSNGLTLRVDPDFDEDALLRLVATLARARC